MASSSRLHTLLKRRGGSVAILDGGMGTALAAHGLTEQQCWTAGESLDDEQIRSAVSSVYEEYLGAGADILTVNTYNISAQKYLNRVAAAAAAPLVPDHAPAPVGPAALHELGSADGAAQLSAEEALAKETAYLNANVALAREALTLHAQKHLSARAPLLAASMGGYATAILSRAETANRINTDEASLAAERVSGYGVGQAVLESFHRSRIRTIIAAGVDLLAFETIPDLVEARAIAAVLTELGAAAAADSPPIEAWITFTCRDGGPDGLTDHGDLFEECVRAVQDCSQMVGVGLNCTEPYLVPLLLSTVREHSDGDKVIVCYPNSGEVYDMRGSAASTGGTSGWRVIEGAAIAGPAEYAEMAQHWHQEGAQVIGGCCRIGPPEIAALSAAFPYAQPEDDGPPSSAL
jgi:homocysteine S-methyltransferase